MFKKFSLLLIAVAVLAFAIPTMANASGITSKAGVLAPVGTAIKATGNDLILTSSTLGSITCAKLILNTQLTKNDGTTVEASGTSEKPVQESCLLGTKTFTWTTITVTKLLTTGTTHMGTLTFDATVDIGTLDCTLLGTNVPFTYTPGGSSIVFSSAAGISGSPAGCGTFKLDGTFALEIGSTAAILD